MPYIEYYMPVVTRSEANLREHWASKARRAKVQRNSARLLTRSALVRSAPVYPVQGTPLRITLVRVNGRRLDPDNLAGSQKHTQDGIADALGIDDGDQKHTWEYKQGKTKAIRTKGVGVRIEW